jgi:hypothetical protein
MLHFPFWLVMSRYGTFLNYLMWNCGRNITYRGTVQFTSTRNFVILHAWWRCRTNSFDISGSVHHRITHIKNPTRCNSVSKFYFRFIWSLTCFGRHTSHHQELKIALAVSGFAYVEGWWPCSCVQQLHGHQPSTYVKPEAASAVLGSWWLAMCRQKHVELHTNLK